MSCVRCTVRNDVDQLAANVEKIVAAKAAMADRRHVLGSSASAMVRPAASSADLERTRAVKLHAQPIPPSAFIPPKKAKNTDARSRSNCLADHCPTILSNTGPPSLS